VQLELWQGLNILASAPLLLLPPLPSPSSTDALLEELHQHVAQNSWTEASESTSVPATGMSAVLSDLGQLLFTVDCITSGYMRAATDTEDGPGLWGGAAAGVRWQHTSDPDILESALLVNQGLIEYAQNEGLSHVAELAGSAQQCISQRLKDCSPSGSILEMGQTSLPGILSGHVAAPDLKRPTFSESFRATIYGFKPQAQEKAYHAWAAQQCARLLLVWKPIFHVLMIASAIGSMRRGDPFSITDIPVHLALCSPHTLAFGLAVAGQHR
jgi:hypothetical protein